MKYYDLKTTKQIDKKTGGRTMDNLPTGDLKSTSTVFTQSTPQT